jgi:hypothetical protein
LAYHKYISAIASSGFSAERRKRPRESPLPM